MEKIKMWDTKVIMLAVGLVGGAGANAAIVVPGTSDMWLAGMPDGSTSSAGDSAPLHSPVLASTIDLTQGTVLFTSVTGKVSYGGGCPSSSACSAADGYDGNWWSHTPGALNGISNINAPINSLLGVFLSDEAPDASAAPSALNFFESGLNFTSLAPELKQVFFIGDGRTDSGELQTFYVPDGATRLYLGTMDGYGWYNNTGEFNVEVAPEVPLPPTALLFLSGMASLFGINRSKAKKA